MGSWHEWSREVRRRARYAAASREERAGRALGPGAFDVADAVAPSVARRSSYAGIGSSSGSSSTQVVSIGKRHLGMELDSPRRLAVEAECLRADALRASSTPLAGTSNV